MNPEVEQILLDLNRDFYTRFGRAFALTRQRIQPGVRRVLERLPDDGTWLDLGCGNGALALAWLESGRQSQYIGLDVSEPLLHEAREITGAWLAQHLQAEEMPVPRVIFLQGDLGREDWVEVLENQKVEGALAMAVLHHLPGEARRQRFVRQVRSLLPVGGWFVFSVWQVRNSPRLMARRQPWERIGLTQEDVEAGDMLLDWRFALPDQEEQSGLRYVHGFDMAEIERLARGGGFEIMESFESDGHGGRLGWYHLCRAAGV
uniref:Class I SAM-dependent methyltransferase n=1 Tax=Anaerolinea thermolimosa TaxID=229919 RepID=A0A7C4KJR7_9CHLR